MADYHSPTVVQPNIPAADMTPLERLILDLVFDAESEACGIYYHSWCGPSDVVTLPVNDLRSACAASHERGVSSIGNHVIALLAQYDADAGGDPPDDIDVDLTDADTGWDQMRTPLGRDQRDRGHNSVYLHEDAAGRLRRKRDAHHGRCYPLPVHN